MAENVQQSVEVPVGLSLFGSLVTEMNPSDLPEGISPDNQDVVYLPGGVGSRAAMRKWVLSLPDDVTVTYQNTFVRPDGVTLNLFVTSDGGFWVQNPDNPAGIGKVVDVTPGSYANSVSGFGKELITFHDGKHGTDIARIFDGYQLDRATQDGPAAPPVLNNVELPAVNLALSGGGWSLERVGNVVSGQTATAHGLKVGNLAFIDGVDASPIGGGIASVKIDNVNNPGIATITTNVPHLLNPENNVFLDGVPSNTLTVVGYSIENGVASVTTSTAHGLSTGSSVLISLGPSGILEPCQVISILSANSFLATSSSPGSSTGTVGSVEYVFPLATQTEVNSSVFEVIACPTNMTFQIAFNYSDGTWAGGIVSFAWNGKFFVTSVPSATSFTYSQNGPTVVTTVIGTVKPYGQASPGIRTAVVMFRFRSGSTSAPSPVSLQFDTNGGQYVFVSSIPIGPPNVVARIIAFTGADGAQYFYIGRPAQVSGITVSTSTIIENNTDTTATFDFSDATLFDSTQIDLPGNNLFELRTLGRPLSVLSYASRAGWFGHRDAIQNLLNMRFDGGTVGSLTNPPGWNVSAAGGLLSITHAKWGFAWKISGAGAGAAGQLWQSGYVDSYGARILLPSTTYQVDFWACLVDNSGGTAGNLLFDFYSPSTGVIATATIPISGMNSTGSWFTATFSAATGLVIPADTQVRLYGNDIAAGTIITVDEAEIFNAANPYVRPIDFSYVNFPEEIDNLSGVLGPTDDDTAVQTWSVYRDSLFFLTQSGLHETNDIAGLEPADWKVRQVADHCGACSPRACDSGENFFAWMTSPSVIPPVGRGLYLYTGGSVYKLSQEIQPDFDAISADNQSSIWITNDSVDRRIYIGIPTDNYTAPSKVYVLDYRELDTASDLASRSPIHVSFAGKMICSDLSRKWTRWNVFANCGDMMKVSGVGAKFSVGGGVGSIAPGAGGFSNSYWFDPTLLTDDDYGQITPYYITYFFVNHEAEQALQVGLHRKLYKRYAMSITGVGTVRLTPLANSLSNPWPSPPDWPLSLNAFYDIGDGLNVSTERCAFKIASQPLTLATDNKFYVSKLIITLMQEPVSPIQFGAV